MAGLIASGVFLLDGILIVAALLLFWMAAAVLLPTIAYSVQSIDGNGGRLFLKKANGAIPLIWLLIYLPFLASRYFNLFLVRLVTPEPAATNLGGALLLGGRLFPWDHKALEEGGVSAVLDVCAELPRDSVMSSLPQYLAVPVLDSSGPTVGQLAQGVDWALSRLQAGEGVLVQCTLGHGRSAIFAAALLLATGRATTVEEAIRIMRDRRPRVGLNRRQKASLEKALRAGVLPSVGPATRPTPRQSL